MSAEWRHARSGREPWPDECEACEQDFPCDAEKMRVEAEDFERCYDEEMREHDETREALNTAREERDAAIRRAEELEAAIDVALDDWESRRVGVIPGGPTARLVADLRFALRSQESQKPLPDYSWAGPLASRLYDAERHIAESQKPPETRYCVHGERDTSECPECGLGFVSEPPETENR